MGCNMETKDWVCFCPSYLECRNLDFHRSSSSTPKFLKTGLILNSRTRSQGLEFLSTISGHSADLVEDIQQQWIYQDCMMKKNKREQASTKLFRPGSHSWEPNL